MKWEIERTCVPSQFFEIYNFILSCNVRIWKCCIAKMRLNTDQFRAENANVKEALWEVAWYVEYFSRWGSKVPKITQRDEYRAISFAVPCTLWSSEMFLNRHCPAGILIRTLESSKGICWLDPRKRAAYLKESRHSSGSYWRHACHNHVKNIYYSSFWR